MIRACFYVALILTIMHWTGCAASGPHARSGAVVGGMTGGAIGALAGSRNNKAVQGAAIGALAGTALGHTLGDQVDEDVQVARAVENASWQAAHDRAVTVADVIHLQKSGVSDELIINQIRNNGMADRILPQDLITLKSNGLSDAVISAMQSTPMRPPSARVVEPVLVRESWGPSPVYPWPHGYHGRHRRPATKAGFHIHF